MKISVFNFSLSNISAIRLIAGKDLEKMMGAEKLPKTLQPLLRQMVISSADLAPFEALRKKVQEFLRQNGSWHDLFGWVTSASAGKRTEIVQFMEAVSKEFYEKKELLLADYEKKSGNHLDGIREQCEESGFEHCSELVALIAKSQPSIDYLEKQIQFSWLRPRLIEVHDDEEDEVITGLFGQALTEIQGRAKRAANAPRVKTQIRAASEIAEKCDSISYIDRRYEGLAKEIRTVLAIVPEREKDSEYQPHERMSLMGMMAVLSDAFELNRKIEAGEGLFPTVTTDQDDLFQDHEAEKEGNTLDSQDSVAPPAANQPSTEGRSNVHSW